MTGDGILETGDGKVDVPESSNICNIFLRIIPFQSFGFKIVWANGPVAT